LEACFKRYLNLVYIAKSGLNEVADYWTNNYNERSSKKTFFEQTLYNTVSDKKSPFGMGFQKTLTTLENLQHLCSG
jgi:uncharacterized protein YfeS